MNSLKSESDRPISETHPVLEVPDEHWQAIEKLTDEAERVAALLKEQVT